MTHIIRTIKELKELDPDTLIIHKPHAAIPQVVPARHFQDFEMEDHLGQIAVIATGHQVRQAAHALSNEGNILHEFWTAGKTAKCVRCGITWGELENNFTDCPENIEESKK